MFSGVESGTQREGKREGGRTLPNKGPFGRREHLHRNVSSSSTPRHLESDVRHSIVFGHVFGTLTWTFTYEIGVDLEIYSCSLRSVAVRTRSKEYSFLGRFDKGLKTGRLFHTLLVITKFDGSNPLWLCPSFLRLKPLY